MVNTVNSSITVTFATAADIEAGHMLYVELDGDKNAEEYGSEKSQFLYGEVAYFRVFKSPSDLKYDIVISDGSLTDHGKGTYVTKEDSPEMATFINTNTARSRLPVKTLTSQEWLGNSLGNVNVSDDVNLIAGKSGVGVLSYSITADFDRKGISVPNKNVPEYPVIIFVHEVL